MAVYSVEHKYIFFANPQTASKAIALTLRQKLGGKPLPEHEITHHGKIVARMHHTTYSQILAAGLLTEEQLSQLLKFTCVRNPYDLLVSKYIKHCFREGDDPARYPWLQGVEAVSADNSFPQWLAWISKRFEEIDKLKKGPLEFLNHADLVIRFEALQEGFDEFLHRIGVTEPMPVTEYNITKGRVEGGAGAPDAAKPKRKKNYTEYYDTACVEIVAKMYEPILQRFNYRFGD
jgi:sulfotransferase famil protein